MERRWGIISTLIFVVFVGIPTAADFYPPLFVGIAERLPLDFIFTWMGRIGVFSLGFAVGWVFRSLRQSEDNSGKNNTEESHEIHPINSIEGCVETNGLVWKGIAEISDQKVVNSEVEFRAYCPHCQTIMYDGVDKKGTVLSMEPEYWVCDNCGHRTLDEYRKYESAEKLFHTDVSRIVESEGKEYSLEKLVERIDGDPTPRLIWEEYAKIVGDHVSTKCFY